ncbi:MAG: nucleoside triphosphate pyrophosphohydrolase [Planctomycetota bacterium]
MDSTRRLTSKDDAPAADPRLVALGRLLTIVDRLRGPNGCPWDKKQTVESMAPHLVEEAFEALEAIETGTDRDVAEEAGDVLMVVTLIARIAQDAGRFDLATAADAVSEKLVRRHPHVFGDLTVDGADEVLRNWEAIKKSERTEKREDDSALAGVPRALPALQRARRLCNKAVSAGFRWEDAAGARAKLGEEARELDDALAGTTDLTALDDATRHAVEHELGDVLLAAAFFAEYIGMDPEKLCRDAARRFEERFRAMETELARPLREHSLAELTAAWQRAKAATA